MSVYYNFINWKICELSKLGAAKKKWSIVTTPHDVTEPPVDLLCLNETLTARLQRRAGSSLELDREKDKLGSLYWVSFAAQRSKFDKDTGNRTSRPSTGLSRVKYQDGKGLVYL